MLVREILEGKQAEVTEKAVKCARGIFVAGFGRFLLEGEKKLGKTECIFRYTQSEPYIFIF